MEAAIYLRQSLDRDGNMLAVSRQREDCEKLAANQGWHWTEYVDNDRSATRGVRPAYQQMLADIADGRVQAVVTWRSDRLYRKLADLLPLMDLCKTHGVTIATVQTGELDLSTDTGRLSATILGAVSENEGAVRTARQKRAIEQRAASGKVWWASRPFGFQFDPGVPVIGTDGQPVLNGNGKPKMDPRPRPKLDAAGRPILDEDEATLIRKAYAAVLAGASLHSIAKGWHASGVTTPKGNAWSGTLVRSLLMAHRNAGLATLHDEVTAEDAWPAIVTRDVFDSVRAVLTEPGRRIGGESTARKHLLSGLAVCGACLKRVGSNKSGDGRQVYICKHCTGCARDMAALDRFVSKLIAERLSRDDVADLLVATERDDIEDLRQRAKALRKQIKQAERDYDEDLIDGRRLAAKQARVGEKLAEVESKMLSANKTRLFDGMLDAVHPTVWFSDLGLDRKRAVIDFFLTITIKPAGRQGRGFKPELIGVRWHGDAEA